MRAAANRYFSSMRSVGLKELETKLGEYVRLAENGETVLVTDHDRVVAEIVPPSTQHAGALPAEDELLADLIRRGLVRPAEVRRGPPPPRTPMMTLAELMAEIDADREDR